MKPQTVWSFCMNDKATINAITFQRTYIRDSMNKSNRAARVRDLENK